MPLQIRAFLVVIFIAVFCFAIVAQPAKKIIPSADFRRWRNLWLSITSMAFLVGNFWLFMLFSTFFIVFHLRQETTKPALYWLLLCVVPPSVHSIPGFGIINRLFGLSMPVLLSFMILIPLLLFSSKEKKQLKIKTIAPDYLVVLFFLVTSALSFRGVNVTVGLRFSFIQILGFLLPYLAFSRKILNFDDIKRTMFAFLLPLFVFGIIGSFEALKQWKLYYLPGITENVFYLGRAGFLRASVTTGGPIVFGYIMMIGIGFLIPLASRYLTRMQSYMAFGALGIGLLSALSRGPWVGTVFLIIIYISTGRNAAKKIVAMGFAGVMLIPFLALTPFWDKFVNLIPFLGTTEKGNIDYRERLFEQSSIVIQRNPLFGSTNYLSTPEMQSLIQGQGIIDIVNTYIRITLNYGFVGLFLFVSFFIVVLINLRLAYKALPAENSEMKQVGRALFATLCAVLLTIATVSSVSFIPYLYWTLAGLAVAYIRVARDVTSVNMKKIREVHGV